MSETETNTGKLIPVTLLNGETNEQYAERIINGEKDSWSKTFLDQLLSDGYREYILHNDILYSVEVERDMDGGDIFHAKKNEDGTINFILQYYNGGCSFTEAMDEALKSITK